MKNITIKRCVCCGQVLSTFEEELDFKMCSSCLDQYYFERDEYLEDIYVQELDFED